MMQDRERKRGKPHLLWTAPKFEIPVPSEDFDEDVVIGNDAVVSDMVAGRTRPSHVEVVVAPRLPRAANRVSVSAGSAFWPSLGVGMPSSGANLPRPCVSSSSHDEGVAHLPQRTL